MLSLIEREEGTNEYDHLDVYLGIPDDPGVDTEEDSDNSDDEHIGDVNHLSRGILQQNCEIRHRFQEDFDEDDLIPLARLFPKPGPSLASNDKKNEQGNKRKKLHKWTKNPPNFSVNKTCVLRDPSLEAKSAKNPVSFFLLFFDENLTTKIVQETNQYGHQKNKELHFTKEELYVLLGGMLLSGYAKYPNKRLYWNSTEDIPDILRKSMRLNRYEMLLRHLHFNDNAKIDRNDKLYKIRPLLEALNRNFKNHGGLEEGLSIDESMIPYYGKHYAKQYIKGKPIRFGYKNWAICNSSGYMISFEVYTGKSDSEKRFGLGGDVIMSLLEKSEVPPSNGHKIFFDNYFTSLNLLNHLSENNICATGTIRENRTEKCPFPDAKTWKPKPRGSSHFVSCENVTFVQWKDNKVVTLGTNYDNNDIVMTTRWCKESKTKKQITQPKIVANYNKYMGGVDKMDKLIALYRTRMRQRKWYWPIVSYLLDASVSNAWVLMKKLMPDDSNCVSLLVFRRYIALSFLQSYGTKPTRGKTTSPYPVASRFDNIGHMIRYNETDRRCQVCKKKSNFICVKCDCGLHPKFCFEIYHAK